MERNLKTSSFISFVPQKGLVMNFHHLLHLSKMKWLKVKIELCKIHQESCCMPRIFHTFDSKI